MWRKRLRIHASSRGRLGFYLTSWGMPNEAYYCTEKAVLDAVFMSAEDVERLVSREGGGVVLRSGAGAYEGRVYLAPVKQESLKVYWP